MFVVFADQASTATHEFNIACMLQKGCYSAKIICKNLSNSHSAKVYTLEIYLLYGTSKNGVQTNLFLQHCVIR